MKTFEIPEMRHVTSQTIGAWMTFQTRKRHKSGHTHTFCFGFFAVSMSFWHFSSKQKQHCDALGFLPGKSLPQFSLHVYKSTLSLFVCAVFQCSSDIKKAKIADHQQKTQGKPSVPVLLLPILKSSYNHLSFFYLIMSLMIKTHLKNDLVWDF